MTKFIVGDLVEKAQGYRFPGVVTAIDGYGPLADRYIVTTLHPDFFGMKHIFSAEQLVLRAMRYAWEHPAKTRAVAP